MKGCCIDHAILKGCELPHLFTGDLAGMGDVTEFQAESLGSGCLILCSGVAVSAESAQRLKYSLVLFGTYADGRYVVSQLCLQSGHS